MVKKFKRWIWISAVLLGVLFATIIALSPYGKKENFDYKLIQTSLEINVSADSVFRYLGNSANAAKWSVFVSDIQPLNADSVPDGAVGSTRRCYSSQGKNVHWDELITEVIPNKKRQLLIYNLVDFPLTANDLATEQRYLELGENSCLLTFTVFYKNNNPTWMESLKTYFAAYKIEDVFEQNMRNIKAICEGKTIQPR